MRIFALLLLCVNLATHAATPACPAGVAVAYFRLEARRPGESQGVPADKVNRLSVGDTIVYFPSDAPVKTDLSDAKVTLLFITKDNGELRVMQTKGAAKRQEWTLPADASAIAVAYGPKGFDNDKMESIATKDPELVAQLADYSEKTAQTEIVLSALAGRRPSDDRVIEGALQGLSTMGGGTKLDRNAPLDQQTLSLMRALNPALGAYDPLAADPQARWQQSAVLASSVAGLFFGSGIGLAGGGASVLLNLRTLMFPRTELRSALLREAPEPVLCSAKEAPSRTRLAYLWARRLPMGKAPELKLARPGHIAAGMAGSLALDATEEQLTEAGRAFRWRLLDGTQRGVELPVSVPANEKSIRIAKMPERVAPGKYTLVANWDWDEVKVAGSVEVHNLPGMENLHLAPDSPDRVITGRGPVRVDIEGAPLYFTESVQILRKGDALARPASLRFAVHEGSGHLETELDTNALPPGEYALTVTQIGGARKDISMNVQNPPPVLKSFPIEAYAGETMAITLAGDRLENIEKLESPAGDVEWDSGQREMRVRVNPGFSGQADLAVYVAGRRSPVVIPAALVAAGQRTSIVRVTRAKSDQTPVALLADEIDAAQPVSFSVQVENAPPTATVAFRCEEPGKKLPVPEVRAISKDFLFVTLPATEARGCTLKGSVAGSAPADFGKIVELPAIERFELSGEPAGDGLFKGIVRGKRLELIEKTGWLADRGELVTELPMPEGDTQKLEIVMPWPAPAPHAPLRIWLRGETEPRLTTSRY